MATTDLTLWLLCRTIMCSEDVFMKILVIGGGMSGLCYAILAARQGLDVTVCEKNMRVGKKIAMSGNGKCNIGNLNVSADCYNDSGIVRRVLQTVTVQQYVDFLRSCGIYVFSDDSGRLYPLNESASGVVDCLRYELARCGGNIVTNAAVSNITSNGASYCVSVNGKRRNFDRVVVACGSPSQADNELDKLIPSQYLTPLCPSLKPVCTYDTDGVINGVRNKAVVSLYADGRLVRSERGEVLFKDYGLSGICVFNLSAYIARDIVRGRSAKSYVFKVDIAPDLSESDLISLLQNRLERGWDEDKLLYGIAKNKLAEHIRKRYGHDVASLVKGVKQMLFTFKKLSDYSMSQVTAGGVDEQFVDEFLRLPSGITVLGEALNVDGVCGGNNLFFAGASAIYAFNKAFASK